MPPRRCGGHRLEAGVAEDHPQRPHDLRLVVADEDAALAAHAAPSRESGKETTKVLPCPGTDSTAISPPLASTKPLAIERPRPDPWPPPRAGRRVRRSAPAPPPGSPVPGRRRGRRGGRRPPASERGPAARRRGGCRSRGDWRRRAPAAPGLRSTPGSRRRSPTCTAAASAPIDSRAASSTPARSTGSRRGSAVAGLEPGDVDQVLNQAREPLTFLNHSRAQLVLLLRGHRGRFQRRARRR